MFLHACLFSLQFHEKYRPSELDQSRVRAQDRLFFEILGTSFFKREAPEHVPRTAISRRAKPPAPPPPSSPWRTS